VESNMNKYGRILLDCSTYRPWLSYKKRQKRQSKIISLIGLIILSIIIFYLAFYWDQDFTSKIVVLFFISIGFVLFLIIFLTRNIYGDLILYEKGIQLPNIGLYVKKPKNLFISYNNIIKVSLSFYLNKNFIHVQYKNSNPKEYYLINKKFQISEKDINIFKEILIQYKVNVEN